MQTRVGKAICYQILGHDVDAIEFHLGVSRDSAAVIAQGCSQPASHPWVYAAAFQDIRKLTVQPLIGRHYALLRGLNNFPIESWTDPYTGLAGLLAGNEGISRARLVQLLSHEMAVYFDPKSNPAHPDAKNIPPLRDLKLMVGDKMMNPLIAASDPMIAHTLTFLRNLQVEFAIIDELVAANKIIAPSDRSDRDLNYLVSVDCQSACILKLITEMRARFMPISLPLFAFASLYRALLPAEIQRVRPAWPADKWTHLSQVLGASVDYLNTEERSNPVVELQRVFGLDAIARQAIPRFESFLEGDLWPIELPALVDARVSPTQNFIEFMKVPLLSGYNIRLSSGPRVRIRTGNVE